MTQVGGDISLDVYENDEYKFGTSLSLEEATALRRGLAAIIKQAEEF